MIQKDEGVSDFEFKQRQMDLQFINKNWERWWSFTPMEFPELEKYILENYLKVLMMNNFLTITGQELSIKEAEFGILIKRLNQLAGK